MRIDRTPLTLSLIRHRLLLVIAIFALPLLSHAQQATSTASTTEAVGVGTTTISTATSTSPLVTKSSWILALGQCESHSRPNLKILDSNHKFSYGLVQFQMSTWLSYGKAFGATAKNIFDPKLQMKVAQSMLDDGLNYNWKTCNRIVSTRIGNYPMDLSVNLNSQ